MDIIKKGLILEGGGLRGIYTAGVLDIFLDENISFDGIIGVSAGAIHGCSYVSKQRGRSIRYYNNYCDDPRFMSMKNWLKTGNVVDTEFCYHTIPDILDPYDHDAFYANPCEYYVTCSNIETGKAEYIRLTDMKKEIDYLRASASLPFFSKTVKIDGKKYIDGGCLDSVPVKAFENMGYNKNVLVLTQPKGYRKSAEAQHVTKLFYGRYKEFTSAFLRRHIDYNDTMDYIDRKEAEGEIFVIRPKTPAIIGRTQTDKALLNEIYNMGISCAKKRIDELKQWLNN